MPSRPGYDTVSQEGGKFFIISISFLSSRLGVTGEGRARGRGEMTAWPIYNSWQGAFDGRQSIRRKARRAT
jgi:hypothetical protein